LRELAARKKLVFYSRHTADERLVTPDTCSEVCTFFTVKILYTPFMFACLVFQNFRKVFGTGNENW